MVRSGDEAEWLKVGRLEVEVDADGACPFQLANEDVTSVKGEGGRAEVVFDR